MMQFLKRYAVQYGLLNGINIIKAENPFANPQLLVQKKGSIITPQFFKYTALNGNDLVIFLSYGQNYCSFMDANFSLKKVRYSGFDFLTQIEEFFNFVDYS